MDPNEPHEKMAFSLVLGGPLYQLWLRSRLAKAPMGWVHRRVAASVAITWLPLLLFATLAGQFLGGAGVSFLSDLDAHVRFLISFPLLILAEPLVHGRLREAVAQFIDRGLIAPEDRPRFEAIIRSTWRLRNSVIVEIAILILALTAGYWLWRAQIALPVATWYAQPVKGSVQYTLAGYWYAFISLPIFRFILFRWCFRLSIWYLFLWRVSRLRLRLNPLHPDRAGGLGFLGTAVSAFIPVLIALTALLSGLIGNQIWHQGAKLPDFKIEIAASMVSLMLIVLVPLAFFFLQMAQAKRVAMLEYGLLANQYVSEFRQKWLHGRETSDKELLGSADIQSLADLGNSYDVVHEMRPLPIAMGLIVRLAIVLALPLLPLTLTMIPLREILDRLIKIVL